MILLLYLFLRILSQDIEIFPYTQINSSCDVHTMCYYFFFTNFEYSIHLKLTTIDFSFPVTDMYASVGMKPTQGEYGIKASDLPDTAIQEIYLDLEHTNPFLAQSEKYYAGVYCHSSSSKCKFFLDLSTENCFHNCSEKGTCLNNACHCDSGYALDDCSGSYMEVNVGGEFDFDVEGDFYFDLYIGPSTENNIVFELQFDRRSAVELKFKVDEYPTEEDFDYRVAVTNSVQLLTEIPPLFYHSGRIKILLQNALIINPAVGSMKIYESESKKKGENGQVFLILFSIILFFNIILIFGGCLIFITILFCVSAPIIMGLFRKPKSNEEKEEPMEDLYEKLVDGDNPSINEGKEEGKKLVKD